MPSYKVEIETPYFSGDSIAIVLNGDEYTIPLDAVMQKTIEIYSVFGHLDDEDVESLADLDAAFSRLMNKLLEFNGGKSFAKIRKGKING